MNYILMIIMFIGIIAVCIIINKSKEDRIVLLKEIKQSTKAFDIGQYFDILHTGTNKNLNKLKGIVDEVAHKQTKSKEAKDKILDGFNGMFTQKSDESMLLRWLSLIKKPDSIIKREEVEKQCSTLIEKCKSEEKSNIYIAITLGVVMIIVLI